MSRNIDCHKRLYLQLNTECKQIFFIGSKTGQGGIIYSEQGVMSLNKRAFDILYKNFVSLKDYTMDQLIDQQDENWINSLLKNTLFYISNEKPCKKNLDNGPAGSSKTIKLCYATEELVIPPGKELTTTLFDDIIVYFVVSDEIVPISSSITASTLMYNDNTTSIYPAININQVYENSAVNLHPVQDVSGYTSGCTVCVQCDACGYCALCIPYLLALTSFAIKNHSCASTATSC